MRSIDENASLRFLRRRREVMVEPTMSRNLLLSLLTVVLLATGLYLGFSRNSLDEEERHPAPLKVQSQSVKPEASKSRTALPGGSLEKRNERAILNLAVLGSSEAQKRDGPVPEEDDVYQLIEEALQSSEAQDRAFAVSELGLLEPTSEIFLACLEALKDTEEDVRAEAVLALEMLEEPAAIPVLQRVIEVDLSQEVREAATEALESLMNP